MHIADLVMKWAALDTAITYWVVLAFDMPMDACSIMLGNMDTKSKLDKLIKLYHHTNHDGLAAAKKLRTGQEKYVDVRNTVAHQRCAGHLKSDPDYMVFHSIRHVKDTPGDFEIICVSLQSMRAATRWANDAEKGVRLITDAMTYRH